MNQNQPKVKLCRLFAKTSKKGNRYMVGRLGAARVILLKEDQEQEEENEWGLYVCEADTEKPSPLQQHPETQERKQQRGKVTEKERRFSDKAQRPLM